MIYVYKCDKCKQEIEIDKPRSEQYQPVTLAGKEIFVSNYGNVIGAKVYNGPDGYPVVSFSIKGKTQLYRVHRLVATIFIDNPKNKRCVNHKDGNRINNNVENLEWCTHSENNLHAYRVLKRKNPQTGKIGNLNKKSIKINQLDYNGNILKTWDSMHDIQRQIGSNVGEIWKCCARKTKAGNKYSSKGYNWEYANANV